MNAIERFDLVSSSSSGVGEVLAISGSGNHGPVYFSRSTETLRSLSIDSLVTTLTSQASAERIS
jgi:hypothetical protein